MVSIISPKVVAEDLINMIVVAACGVTLAIKLACPKLLWIIQTTEGLCVNEKGDKIEVSAAVAAPVMDSTEPACMAEPADGEVAPGNDADTIAPPPKVPYQNASELLNEINSVFESVFSIANAALTVYETLHSRSSEAWITGKFEDAYAPQIFINDAKRTRFDSSDHDQCQRDPLLVE